MVLGVRGQEHSLWRGPLWLAFLLGCVVSASASGRFSVRLIADGAVSFAFIPAFEMASLFVVCRIGARARPPFAQVVDRFFAAEASWWVWLAIFAATLAVVPPRSGRSMVKLLMLAGVVPLALTSFAHARFFRDVMQRRPDAAWRDVVLQRLISGGAGMAYYFGLAVWRESVPQILRRFFP